MRESFAAGLDRICVISGITALAAGLLVLAVVRGGPGAAAKSDAPAKTAPPAEPART